ncbi:fimbria/pilus periplasmic chaperone [Deinococcus sp. HMF7620]|uniref:Fimbria/pilus periplasmic chaperone n=1 Tax=Deinococcus arboris TaxID=2682977 RepID=A0A7C9I0B9_9DEIO|nr:MULTISPECIES: fimbria/pilus periplasmic chaperone [Deinococcus]MBZ9750065.1 fimbria/pilus periplasmic chaperone [Deinococcus betulae]MVN87735.1 fimbria/pilus periplasmic chaperone [Deinococcus arboris]
MKRLTLAALVLLGTATAQNFSLSPTAFNLDPARTNTSQVRLQNPGKVTLKFQVEVRKWTTENGQHAYSSTRDVVVNPATFTLGPGESQVIRLGLLKKAGADELTYRVFVKQVPAEGTATQQVSSGAANMNLAQLVQLSLPVYVTPANSAPKISFRARKDGSTLTLDVINSGNQHQTFRALSVVTGGQEIKLGSTAVLGRTTLSLPLKGVVSGPLELRYTDTNDKEWSETLSIP